MSIFGSNGRKEIIFRRFSLLTLLTILAWSGVYLHQVQSISSDSLQSQKTLWPPLKNWQKVVIDRLSQPSITLIKSGSSDQDESLWSVHLEGQRLRPIDPLLFNRFKEELSAPQLLETRSLINQVDVRPLGLTTAALKISISTLEEQKYNFRVGAEHLRHSTWVRSLSSSGDPSLEAWLMTGRLRRALDHLAHKWPDRRMSLDDQTSLRQIKCFQGELHTPLEQRRRSWSLGKLDSTWEALTDRPKPTLHQPSVRSFVYTLSSLRVSRFLDPVDLPDSWKPTSTCLWSNHHGQSSGLSFGRALLKSKKEYVYVVKNDQDIGLIPNHIAHFLVTQFSSLLSRRLSMTTIDRLQEVSYTPPSTPLLAAKFSQSAWRIVKTNTGWWRIDERGKELLSEQKMMDYWSVIDKEAAQVMYQPKSSDQLEESGAYLRFKLSAEVCDSKDRAQDSSVCSFELYEQSVAGNTTLKSWWRPKDGLLFMLTPNHHQALVSSIKP